MRSKCGRVRGRIAAEAATGSTNAAAKAVRCGPPKRTNGAFNASDPYHQFAAVLAGEHAGERRRHFLEPFNDIDCRFDFSLFDPSCQCRFRLALAVVEVHHDKAFHANAFGTKEPMPPGGPGGGLT